MLKSYIVYIIHMHMYISQIRWDRVFRENVVIESTKNNQLRLSYINKQSIYYFCYVGLNLFFCCQNCDKYFIDS